MLDLFIQSLWEIAISVIGGLVTALLLYAIQRGAPRRRTHGTANKGTGFRTQ